MAGSKARVQPRRFIVTFWHGRRLFVRVTKGRDPHRVDPPHRVMKGVTGMVR